MSRNHPPCAKLGHSPIHTVRHPSQACEPEAPGCRSTRVEIMLMCVQHCEFGPKMGLSTRNIKSSVRQTRLGCIRRESGVNTPANALKLASQLL